MNMISPSVPRIDVLIPAYNVESTVVEAVQSILDQTIRNIRVVVVDDGSTDRTAELLARMAAADARLVVHRQPNGGIVDALNNGLALCSGEVVARHDGDDIAFADRLEKQIAYLDAHPDCIAVGANAWHIDERGRRLGSHTMMPDPGHADVDAIPAEEPYLIHPLLMVRRSSLSAVGGYRYVFHSEDTDLYWRLRGLGRLHNMADILAEYRIHAQSVSGKSILNGRVQAISSQLAALSERRRLAGISDISFPRERLNEFHQARSLAGIMSIAEAELSTSELPHFRIAVAAKLLELDSYRPYTLDNEDRRFVKSAFSDYSNLLSSYSVKFLGKRQARYIMKRLLRGDGRAAAGLMRLRLVPAIFSLMFNFLAWNMYKKWSM